MWLLLKGGKEHGKLHVNAWVYASVAYLLFTPVSELNVINKDVCRDLLCSIKANMPENDLSYLETFFDKDLEYERLAVTKPLNLLCRCIEEASKGRVTLEFGLGVYDLTKIK